MSDWKGNEPPQNDCLDCGTLHMPGSCPVSGTAAIIDRELKQHYCAKSGHPVNEPGVLKCWRCFL